MADSLKRLVAIFRTSNLHRFPGRAFFSIPQTNADMLPVYQVLEPIPAARQSWLSSGNEFDLWHENLCDQVAKAYSESAPFPLGIAQKTVNLFLKDLWAWDQLDQSASPYLHAVVDREIVKRLVHLPPQPPLGYSPGWRQWSFVRYSSPTELKAAWKDYMNIQRELSRRASAQSISRVELEQRLWAGDR